MGETDSADKFMVLVVEYSPICSYWNNEKRGILQIGQPQVIKEIDGKNVSQLKS
jgi:hypothetical protein